MGKKLSSLALCMVFLLSLMPNISLLAAAENKPTSVQVGGTEVIAGGYWITKDGKLADGTKDNWNVRYDKSTNTLYLRNASVENKDNKGLFSDGDLTLKFSGNNSINGIMGGIISGDLRAEGFSVVTSSIQFTGSQTSIHSPEYGLGVMRELHLSKGCISGTATGKRGTSTYGIAAATITVENAELYGYALKDEALALNFGIKCTTREPIILKNGKIIAESHNNTALGATLPKTPFWFRTMDTMDFADGLTEGFKPDQAAYVEMITSGTNVSYDANGGTGTMVDNYVYHNGDGKISVPECKFTKEGHKFVGFKRSDNGEIVQPGKEIKFSTKDSVSTLKLIAQWEKNKETQKPADTNTDGNKTTNKPKDTSSSNNNNIPQTGDTSNLLPFLTLSVVSACMLAAVMLTLKKRKENN